VRINAAATPLVDISNFPTLATITATNTGGNACAAFPFFGVATPEADLFNDFENVPDPGSTTWTVTGLAVGTYNVYLYCWDSIATTGLTKVTLPSGGAPVTCGGWAGAGIPPLGGAYVADLNVASLGTLSWTIDFLLPTTYGSFSGVQIVQVGSGCQPENYCPIGTTSSGCNPRVTFEGTPSATKPDGFVITAVDLEGQTNGMFIYSVTNSKLASWCASGGFFICVQAPLSRVGIQNSGGTNGFCDGFFVQDFNSYIFNKTGEQGEPWFAGEQVWLQAYFREPSQTCTKKSGMTDGLTFFMGP